MRCASSDYSLIYALCLQTKFDSYLTTLEEKRVPDVEVRFNGDVVYEDAEEPVEGEEPRVDVVGGEVRAQPRQLLHQELLENLLQKKENMIVLNYDLLVTKPWKTLQGHQGQKGEMVLLCHETLDCNCG